jgi:hypothetical protein
MESTKSIQAKRNLGHEFLLGFCDFEILQEITSFLFNNCARILGFYSFQARTSGLFVTNISAFCIKFP